MATKPECSRIVKACGYKISLYSNRCGDNHFIILDPKKQKRIPSVRISKSCNAGEFFNYVIETARMTSELAESGLISSQDMEKGINIEC